MLDFSFGELGLVVLVALLVVGPQDMPKVMRAIGKWAGQFRGIVDEFRQGFESSFHEEHLGDVHHEMRQIQEEVQYIRDEQGNLQRVYDISDFLDERDRSKALTKTDEQQ